MNKSDIKQVIFGSTAVGFTFGQITSISMCLAEGFDKAAIKNLLVYPVKGVITANVLTGTALCFIYLSKKI